MGTLSFCILLTSFATLCFDNKLSTSGLKLKRRIAKNAIYTAQMKMSRHFELIALIAVAGCIRSPITSIGPQINAIRGSQNLGIIQFGFLTAIPVICFALAAPLPSLRIFRKIKTEQLIVFALLALAGATIFRTLGTNSLLFGSTVVLGISIAILNIVTPALVRRDYPKKITTVMPIYSAVLALMASLGAGLSIPIATYFDDNWKIGISVWAIPAILVAVIWVPLLRKAQPMPDSHENHFKELLKSKKAWLVSIYMGVQSATFYTQVAWMPKMLMDKDYSAAEAGALFGLSTLCGFALTLILPLVLSKGENLKSAILATSVPGIAGFLGLTYLSNSWTIPALILISTTHAALPLALGLIALKSPSLAATSHLSSMAQGIGYCIAAIFPLIIGYSYSATDSWKLATYLIIGLIALQATAGLKANR
jgi:CP family cyanate transporter-like MFS transporter